VRLMMSTSTATQQPAPHSALRRLVARHPVAAFLVMANAVTIAFAVAALTTQADIRLPFDLPLLGALDHFVGVALPAFLVMAALYGRAGVRDLARRSFRWRVGARWYLFALLGLPIGTLLIASAFYGRAPLNALADGWPLLFTLLLPDLLLRILLFNLTEEIGWTGFLQARLQDRYGPLKACVLVEVPFALWHLPGLIVDTGGELPIALLFLGVFAVAQFFGRIVIMWLYNNTNRSVLLVGLFHSTYNTTVNRIAGEFIPGPAESGFFIASGVVAVAAVLLIAFTRGRLSYKENPVSQIADAPLTKG
jgi:uncharacterized protein